MDKEHIAVLTSAMNLLFVFSPAVMVKLPLPEPKEGVTVSHYGAPETLHTVLLVTETVMLVNIFRLIEKMLTNKKFKEFFQKNIVALKA